MKPLSYTQISLYQSCPLCYKFQYIDRLKSKERWYFSFGRTMHTCAEYFFKIKVPPPPSLGELLRFYKKSWVSEGYESAEEEAKYRAYGEEILTRFHEIHSADFRMPFAVESLFNIDVDGVKLTGFIDRVDKLDSGGLAIVDYKTDARPFTVDDLKANLQLTMYQLAAEKIWNIPVERLTLYHLRSNTPCTCKPRDEAQIDEARNLVLKVAAGITEERFPAVENRYCPCDFPEYCPYYRQKHEESLPETRQTDILHGMTPEQAVEQFVLLQNRIKELQLQFDDVKQVIIDFCRAEELNRVYSGKHAITYKQVERTGFSEDEVRALLGSEGLWQQVLGLDQDKLKQLITDETVALDVRNKLEALRRVISTYPKLSVKELDEEK